MGLLPVRRYCFVAQCYLLSDVVFILFILGETVVVDTHVGVARRRFPPDTATVPPHGRKPVPPVGETAGTVFRRVHGGSSFRPRQPPYRETDTIPACRAPFHVPVSVHHPVVRFCYFYIDLGLALRLPPVWRASPSKTETTGQVDTA